MEKIGKLKDLMLKHDLDGYIIPKNDEFFTEYVPNFKDKLNFISNFSNNIRLLLKERRFLYFTKRGPIEVVFNLKHYLSAFILFIVFLFKVFQLVFFGFSSFFSYLVYKNTEITNQSFTEFNYF